jgi:metallophosphoesterase superfamily enzyme
MTGKKRLIVLGDLKHNLPISSFSEKEETPFFLDLPVEITIIKGNHDADIEMLTSLPVLKEFVIDDVYLTHGHMTIPEEYLTKDIVVGHSHPAIELKDRMGKRYVEKCWVQGKIRGIIKWYFCQAFPHCLLGLPSILQKIFQEHFFPRISLMSVSVRFISSMEHTLGRLRI